MASPYDGITTTGLVVNSATAAPWNATITIYKGTFINCSFTDFPAQTNFIGCIFQNCTVTRPRPYSCFVDCYWTGAQPVPLSLGFTNDILLANCTFDSTPRGPCIQLQPGQTFFRGRFIGLTLLNIGQGNGNGSFLLGGGEWLLAEGGSYQGATVQDTLVDGVILNNCAGRFTLSNLNVSGMSVMNVQGTSQGVYCYNTPQGTLTNGTISNLALRNWRHTGGRVQFDTIVQSSLLDTLTWINPQTNAAAGANAPVFNSGANNKTANLLKNTTVIGRPSTMSTTYGFGTTNVVFNP